MNREEIAITLRVTYYIIGILAWNTKVAIKVMKQAAKFNIAQLSCISLWNFQNTYNSFQNQCSIFVCFSILVKLVVRVLRRLLIVLKEIRFYI